ncbi:MAG: HAD family hydrolase [Chloroflexi bacterium]|nr:HAD family hydrolase [Chloroflexota bacterium]
MGIQVAVLDLDETLVAEYAAVEKAFRATCRFARSLIAAQGRSIEEEALYTAVRRISREWWHRAPAREYALAIGISSWEGLRADFVGEGDALCALRAWAPTYRYESWSRALAEQGVVDGTLPDLLVERFRQEMSTPPALYPDALPVVRQLRERYRLALLTNGLPELQGPKIAALGLEPFFELIVISGALGVGKPAPIPFLHILERLNVSPQEAVMVGNNWRADIGGAHGIGMRTVWVHRPSDESRGDEALDASICDAVITELSQLPDALARLEHSATHAE